MREPRREWKREQKSYVLVVNVPARTTLVFPFVFFQKRKSGKEEREKRRMCVSESLTPIYYHHSICARIMHSTCQSEHKSKIWRERERERRRRSEKEKEYGSEERVNTLFWNNTLNTNRPWHEVLVSDEWMWNWMYVERIGERENKCSQECYKTGLEIRDFTSIFSEKCSHLFTH